MIKTGPWEICSVATGKLRFDGGAVFGVVPIVQWRGLANVDSDNRVLFSTRSLIAVDRAEKRVVVVDTGCGSKWDAKKTEQYAISHDDEAIPKALETMGLEPKDVTDVILTHLHFDQNGGLTHWADEPGGATALQFPDATHWVHERHWAHANQPHIKDRVSFLTQDFLALADCDRLNLIEDDKPEAPWPAFEWQICHGHTPYQLLPIFGEGEGRIAFVGDLIPTVAHLRLAWVMAYDMQPTVSIEEKQALIRRCLEEKIALAFAHDADVPGAVIERPVERPTIKEKLDLSPAAPA